MDLLFRYADSSSESSSSEDLENFDSLYGGQACFIMSSLAETTEKIDNFLLFERKFVHGDIVRMASDSMQQTGMVVNVEMTMNLETIDGYKLENVYCRNLQRIRSVLVDDYVVLGPWFGKVVKIIDHLTLLLDDGTKCDMIVDGNEKITILPTDVVEDSIFPFYPGQRIQVELPSGTKVPHWLCGKRKDKKNGTILNVDVGVAYVDWLCCTAMNVEKVTFPPPDTMQDPQNLTVLSAFPHTNWSVGDCCMVQMYQTSLYPFCSLVMTREKKDEMFNQNVDIGSGFLHVAIIIGTKEKYDVIWQDGNQSLMLDSKMLTPVHVVDPHDFWPHTFVLGKGTLDVYQVQNLQQWGVVKNVKSKERIAQVEWCKLSSSEEDHALDTVSSYELIEHTDYSFHLGEVVYSTDSLKGDYGYHMEDDINRKFLSSFGTVVRLENGYIKVKWADDKTSKVSPYEIRKINKCKDISISVSADENAQLVTEDISSSLSSQTPKNSSQKNKNVDSHDVNSFSHVVRIFSNAATSIFGSFWTSEEIPSIQCDGHCHEIPLAEAFEHESSTISRKTIVTDDNEQYPCDREVNFVAVPRCIDIGKVFKQFEMVNECSDHHFFKESTMEVQPLQIKGSWLKKIHKEWIIMDKDLPETIFVRAYGERIDLLRAAIVGVDGTPYHDGLFFFDIHLPPQYPHEPPMVHYNSGGFRINPNLYESGKVCLSLLNTWIGHQSEVWNPESSTILQVLLSLQALVLNDKPYFNEAGYDSQIRSIEGENNSVNYNENAFLINCKSMLNIIRQPPKNFEEIVEDHFTRRCRKILLACEAYMEGAPLGNPFHCENSQQGTQMETSAGFKIMLSKLYPLLAEAFSQIARAHST